MLVLWLYHYRFLGSLKLQITEILLTFMKFFFRLLWILPTRKRSFTKMSFVLRIVLVCKITTTALIKKINIQTKQTEHLNKQLENFQFKVRLSLRRKSQRKRKRKRKFSHAFSHALALAFALLPMSICLHYLLRLRPRFFFSCLFDRSMPELESALGCIRGIQTWVFRIPDFHIVFASTHVRCVLYIALKVFKQYLGMT